MISEYFPGFKLITLGHVSVHHNRNQTKDKRSFGHILLCLITKLFVSIQTSIYTNVTVDIEHISVVACTSHHELHHCTTQFH